jgi:hypothetical protein
MWAWKRSSGSCDSRRLGVEVEPAGGEAAHAQHDQHDLRGEVEVGGELVGVPADELVATVGIDRAERPALAATVSSCSMVWPARSAWLVSMLSLKCSSQIVFAQEVEAGAASSRTGGWWAPRLRLDVELAGEADLLLVVDRHVKERGEVVELALHVGVEQGGVAFAPAPEGVAFAAEGVGRLDRLLHLGRGVGEDVGVRRGPPALVVARVAKRQAVPQSSFLPVSACFCLR